MLPLELVAKRMRKGEFEETMRNFNKNPASVALRPAEWRWRILPEGPRAIVYEEVSTIKTTHSAAIEQGRKEMGPHKAPQEHPEVYIGQGLSEGGGRQADEHCRHRARGRRVQLLEEDGGGDVIN